MQISSRFTVAVQMLIGMEVFGKEQKVTSELLASSANVNPVVIRRLLQELQIAGLVRVKRGSGGAEIDRPLEQITLLDVYRAVECVEDGQLFHFHEDPNVLCPVGRNIHGILDQKLEAVQAAMEAELKKTTLNDLVENAYRRIGQN